MDDARPLPIPEAKTVRAWLPPKAEGWAAIVGAVQLPDGLHTINQDIYLNLLDRRLASLMEAEDETGDQTYRLLNRRRFLESAAMPGMSTPLPLARAFLSRNPEARQRLRYLGLFDSLPAKIGEPNLDALTTLKQTSLREFLDALTAHLTGE